MYKVNHGLIFSESITHARNKMNASKILGKHNVRVLTCIFPITFCGCADPSLYFKETNYVDSTAAFQITDRDIVEDIDLGWLLIRYAPPPHGGTEIDKDSCSTMAKYVPSFAHAESCTQTSSAYGGTLDSKDNSTNSATTCLGKARLDQSLGYFNCRIHQTGEEDRKLARNALQERLLTASRQRCNAFQANLQREFSRTNFALGSATTTAGALGALVNSPVAAGNWAAAAAIFSGVRSEYNQDYMSNLAAHVIIDGIDRRLATTYEQIQKLGQAKDYNIYPVEAAIKDALYFHGQCSVTAGFQQAADAIRYQNDPGLNGALQTIARVRSVARALNDKNLSTPELNILVETVTKSTPIQTGTTLNDPLADQRPESSYKAMVDRAIARIDLAKASLDDQNAAFTKKLSVSAPTAADLGLDQTIPDPLSSFTIRIDCKSIANNLLNEITQQRTLISASTIEADKANYKSSLAASLSKFNSIAGNMELLAKTYELTTATHKISRADLFNKATNAVHSNGDVTAFKNQATPSLDQTLATSLTAMCK